MELRLLPLFAIGLLVAVAVSHAAHPSENYWEAVLPNTPMPRALRDLLRPADLDDEKSTAVNVGKGGIAVNTGKPSGGGTNVDVGKGGVAVNTGKPSGGGTNVDVGKGGVAVNTGKPSGGGTHVGVGGKGVGVNTGKPGGKTNVNVGKGGVSVSTGHKGKPVIVHVGPKSPFLYQYAATEDQLHDDPQVALFFLEKDLKPEKKMNLQFTKTTNGATFLPRQISEAIPFSSKSLPEILNKFSVEPSSLGAEAMKNTIEECEKSAQKGEDKYCATSLESMIDFSTSKLGTNVQAIATESEDTKQQEYTIKNEVKKVSGEETVVCHGQKYAYAVFYCHATSKTSAYKVPMVGADGSEVKAVAVCHKDTATWNPKHVAFQVLKVQPGTVPICHFLPEDHIVWAPKQKST
ncbi:hypothetical protein Scep_007631 [Stephania cephalantha]|uniref:BURP domain-containing protein n=1 Tax=Stephania cephalantha TaxID=152367 RepID=A0AAP0KBZ2_9MAGN